MLSWSPIHCALGLAAAILLMLAVFGSQHASAIKIRPSNNNNHHHHPATLRGEGARNGPPPPRRRRRHLTEADKQAIKSAYGLKAAAELPLQEISPSNTVTVNAREYSLDGLAEAKVRTSSFTATVDGQPVDVPPAHKYLVKKLDGGATLRVIQDANTGAFMELLVKDGTDATSLITVQGDEMDGGLFVAIRASDYEDLELDPSAAAVVAEPIAPPPDNSNITGGEEYGDEAAKAELADAEQGRQRELQAGTCTTFYHVEVAVRYDSTFCAEYGPTDPTTVARIEDIVFMASANYEVPGLCVTLRLAHTEGFCTGDAGTEPLRNEIDTLSVSSLLDAFNTYQQTVTGVQRDIFHLFVGQRFSNGSGGTDTTTRGLAFSGFGIVGGPFVNGVVCNPSIMSAVNSLGGTPLLLQSLIFAHELGHNHGAVHIADPSSIMNAVITNPINGFSSASISTMATFLQFTKVGGLTGSLAYLNGCLDDPDPSNPSPDITDPVTSCLFNDPCSGYTKSENFQCDAEVECPPNSDCFDCDSFQQFKNSCAACVAGGGNYCEFDNGGAIQGVCSSSDIASTVPTFCSEKTSGTAYVNEECNCPGSTTTCTAGGDPHFSTWAGHRFNYHGQCDLVMVHSKSFQGDKGLDIHVRTRIEQQFFSLISAVAVKVGDSVFEFNHETVGAPQFFVDGRAVHEIPYSDENFSVTMQTLPHEGEIVKVFTVDLGHKSVVKLDVLDRWVFVDITAANKDVADSVGLAGSFPDGRILGRDGTDLSADRNAYGSQWQVQGDEPTLFHSTPAGHPVAPHDTCKLPTLDAHQHLRTENAEMYRMAVDACRKEGLTAADLTDCIFDVSATKMVNLATAWWGKERAEKED